MDIISLIHIFTKHAKVLCHLPETPGVIGQLAILLRIPLMSGNLDIDNVALKLP
jgi:hypothetical protein